MKVQIHVSMFLCGVVEQERASEDEDIFSTQPVPPSLKIVPVIIGGDELTEQERQVVTVSAAAQIVESIQKSLIASLDQSGGEIKARNVPDPKKVLPQ